ncbi:MAG: 6-carboxytetrahydropterin synthase [Chlamydiae bacterium]|nr:MAG: 6-carboxytetrahydropterin synthase [Chlamydiota bacterium]
MLIVTRTIHFCAAHRLYNDSWSESKNRDVFGKCSNEGGHGHNYTIKISVTGPINKQSGMVVNVTSLRDILKREIFDKLDHRDLDKEVEFLKGQISTMENIIVKISKILEEPLNKLGVKIVKLELNESDKNSVTLEL